jgi:hypothetical protein
LQLLVGNYTFRGYMEKNHNKKDAIELIEKLSDDASMNSILEELYIKMIVEEGARELNEGKGITHKEI